MHALLELQYTVTVRISDDQGGDVGTGIHRKDGRKEGGNGTLYRHLMAGTRPNEALSQSCEYLPPATRSNGLVGAPISTFGNTSPLLWYYGFSSASSPALLRFWLLHHSRYYRPWANHSTQWLVGAARWWGLVGKLDHGWEAIYIPGDEPLRKWRPGEASFAEASKVCSYWGRHT